MAKRPERAARPAAQAPPTPDPGPDVLRNLASAASEMGAFLKRHVGKLPAHYGKSFAVKLGRLGLCLVPLRVPKYRDPPLWEGWTLDTPALVRDIENATQLITDTFCVTVEEHNEGRDPPDKAAKGMVKRSDVNRLRLAGRDLLAIVDRNYPVRAEKTPNATDAGTRSKAKRRSKRKPGGQPKYDRKADQKVADAWKGGRGQFGDLYGVGKQFSMTHDEVVRVLDRVRYHRKKAKSAGRSESQSAG